MLIPGVDADERKRKEIRIRKLWFISMATTNPQQSWNVKRDPGYLNMVLILLFFCCERF
jgi:hypothetical protein